MTWNYRILAHKSGGYVTFKVHEVHYDENGEPIFYSESSAPLIAECIDEFKFMAVKIYKCVNKPVLSAKNFPEEYKSNVRRLNYEG